MKPDQTRSELQERIAADLRAKAAASSHTGDGTAPTGGDTSVEQSEYLKGTKQTTTLAGVWLVVGFLALLTFGFFVALTINGQQ